MPGLIVAAITKTDVYIASGVILIAFFLALVVHLFRNGVLPSMNTLADLCAMVNTKGGIIVLLTMMWFITLGGTAAICLWAIVHGVDPQNGILVVLLSVLTSGAWGNVNGALFKTMTGDEPKKNGNGAPAPAPPIPNQ